MSLNSSCFRYEMQTPFWIESGVTLFGTAGTKVCEMEKCVIELQTVERCTSAFEYATCVKAI